MASRGSIITFYSYKGGVGRSFILVSVAVTLAAWGRKVLLCLDWDLEAPGLSHYLRRWMPPARGGVVDMLEELTRPTEKRDWREHVLPISLPLKGKVQFDIIPPGSADGYTARMQDIDWQRLYEHHNLGEYLEYFRADIASAYDFVLVDSRTGITDSGGICTVQMPDLLAMVLTANEQGLEGTLDIAIRIRNARDRLVFDRTGLPIIPILSRFDAREERQLSERWLARVADRLHTLYEPWIPQGVRPSEVLERTIVPYVSYWSFGEGIPTLEETAGSPEMVSWSLETLAALIANGLGDVHTLVNNRDQFVSSARLQTQQTSLKHDVFLSYPRRELATALKVSEEFSKLGASVFMDVNTLTPGESWTVSLQTALASSRHLVVLIRDELAKIQEHEIRQFIVGLLDRNIESRVVVLKLADGSFILPPALASFPSVHMVGSTESAVEDAYNILEHRFSVPERKGIVDDVLVGSYLAGEGGNEIAQHRFSVPERKRIIDDVLVGEYLAGDGNEFAVDRVLTGESLVGEGNEIAHIDLIMGPRDSAAEEAFCNALTNQKDGFSTLLALVAPNLPTRPYTILYNKVTMKGAKQVVQMFGPAQRAVAMAVTDSVESGLIPASEADDIFICVGVFIFWLAEDDNKIQNYNYQATKEAIERAVKRLPRVPDVIAKKGVREHPYAAHR